MPVVVSTELEAPASHGPPTAPTRRRRRRTSSAGIELEIDGVVVRVGRDGDAGAIAAVIGELKAGS